MAKPKERIQARQLRRKGLSLKEIATRLKISKSSASLWCSDIELAPAHIRTLHEKMVRGSYEGRMKGVRLQKEKKAAIIKECLSKGFQDFPKLSSRELLIAGLGLYWGEGAKNGGVRFHNSNSYAVTFIMRWFREALKIEDERFLMHILINSIHKDRLREVVEHWSVITGIAKKQFRKPVLIKAKNKKFYENFSDHYGTLSIRIAKSKYLLYQIQGWIAALSKAG